MFGSGVLSGNLNNFISCLNEADYSIGHNCLDILSSQKLIKSSLVLESNSLSFEFINLSSEKGAEAEELTSQVVVFLAESFVL